MPTAIFESALQGARIQLSTSRDANHPRVCEPHFDLKRLSGFDLSERFFTSARPKAELQPSWITLCAVPLSCRARHVRALP